MKTNSKTRSCLLIGMILPIILLVVIWLGLVVWSSEFGARRAIIEQFPSAKLYPENTSRNGLGDPFQTLMPEGFILPGIRADVVIYGKGTEISFKKLHELNIGYLRVIGCRINDWDCLITGELGDVYVLITDSEFVGGDIESRETLSSHKVEPAVEGDTCYSFGNAR